MKLKKHILVTSLGVTMSLLTVASTGCDAIGAAKDFVVDGYNKVEDFVGDLLGKDPVENPNENPNEDPNTPVGGGLISSDWTEIPENQNENLKYFGYFHSDGFGTKQGSYIAEIAALGHANIVMINSAWDINEALINLAEAKAYGMKAIVSVHCVFRGGVTGKLDSAGLRDDWQASWDTYQAAVQSYIDDGTIYAFYFDEPRWNGINAEDFKTATKYIREKSGVGIMACMTAMDIGIGNYGGVGECEDDYMQYCTDVMFDTYSKWDDETRREYLQMLKDKSPEDAWIWGCPKGFEAEPEINGIEIMVNHIKGQYTEAIQDERYAGIISFSYASGTEEGDWGYGMHDFFNDQNDYYSKELKDLYTDIGCEVTGMTPPEKINLDFVVKEATETYKLNDQISLPQATATDDKGKTYTVSMTVTAPDGSAVEVVDGKFTATQRGGYKVVCSVDVGAGKTVQKETYLYVKQELEISTFESVAFDKDHTGDDDDKWCWPRALDLTFGRNGSKGSLKVTPHATDGNWPNVYFRVDGKKKFDITPYGGFSAWIYNDSNEDVTTMGIKFNNGQNYKEATKTFTLKAKEWTYVSVTNIEMQQMAEGIDLTKVNISICNSLTPYTNRAVFYIDDVFFLPEGAQPELPEPEEKVVTEIGFENEAEGAYVVQNNDNKWCWPTAISNEMAKSGNASLKVTPHATDGNWPKLELQFGAATFDMTDYDKVSLWVYNTGDSDLVNFGLAVFSGDKTVENIKNVPAGEWTEYVITKEALVAAGADITALQLEFRQCNGTYENRAAFYIDDVKLLVNEIVEPEETVVTEIGFENEAEGAYVVQNDDNKSCWPTAISNEMAKSGNASLKVTPHAEWGTWPKLELQFGTATFDMTDYDKVSLWVYNTGDSDLVNFGLAVFSGDKTVENIKNVPAGEWTEYVITKEALVAAGADITALQLEFRQCNGTYENRAAFYIDDVKLLVDETVEPEPEQPEEKVVTEVGFETEDEKDWVVMNADSAWAWPSAISNEMAKSGTYSFKVTPRADGGKWPKMEIQFGAATFDMTNYDKVSLWIYNAGDSEFPNFGLMILDASDAKVQITKNVPAGEWTQFVVTKAMMTAKGLDITALRLEFGNCNSDYPNRAVFYIDDVKLEEAAAVIDTKELGFESDAELANIKYDGENNIFWPTTISSEQAKSGNSSLKVTPHASWGTWPSFHFMFGESITVDMTNYTKISLWVYNSGEENIPSLGMAAYSGNNKVEYTKDAVAGEWTEYVITKDALVAAGVDITAVSIKFGNYNGVYTNRAVFYIDDVKLS